MQTLAIKRIATVAGASAAALVGIGVAENHSADAAVVYSGLQNLSVPATTAGLYINVVTNSTAVNAASDINPWKSTSWLLNGSFTIQPDSLLVASGGTATVLAPGTPIDATNATVTSSAATLSPGTNLYGFRFFDEVDSQNHFAWIRLTMPDPITTATPGVAVDWAYEDVAGAAIAAGDTGGVPEPASLSLLALGAVGLLRRRGVARD